MGLRALLALWSLLQSGFCRLFGRSSHIGLQLVTCSVGLSLSLRAAYWVPWILPPASLISWAPFQLHDFLSLSCGVP